MMSEISNIKQEYFMNINGPEDLNKMSPLEKDIFYAQIRQYGYINSEQKFKEYEKVLSRISYKQSQLAEEPNLQINDINNSETLDSVRNR